MSELREFTIPSIDRSKRQEFSIVSPQERDSLGTEEWKKYLNPDRLLDAWSPPKGSFFKKFQKTKAIEAIEKIVGEIKPRYSEGERRSEQGVENLINSGLLSEDTAVILDSGGAHSVAMAVKLVEQGYQPVVMFDTTPNPRGSNRVEQGLVTLLYFAHEVDQLKKQGKVNKESPPVFIMDTHRNDFIIKEEEVINNNYSYSESDLPSTEELRRKGIRKIIYLNEGDQNGRIQPNFQSIDRVAKDLKQVVKNWERSRLQILYTGVSPWPRRDRGSNFGF